MKAKKLLFYTTLVNALYCMPALGQEIEGYGPGYPIETTNEVSSEIKYTNTDVFVYKEADLSSEVIGNLSANTEVAFLSGSNEWSYICLNNEKYAYIPSVYLSSDRATTNANNRWNITLTPEEFDMMCRIVMLESGGESDHSQQGVTEVICNRMVDPDFPNTLHGVISQKGQFTPYKKLYSAAATPTQRVIDNVWQVLNGNTSIFPQSTVYFARKAENGRVQARIGKQVFCNK